MKDLFTLLFITGIAWLIWRTIANQRSPTPPQSDPPPKEAAELRHIRNSLAFAKTQHKTLSLKQREQDAWQKAFGETKATELDALSGVEFEVLLAGLFRAQGYAVDLTPASGDYGADLLLTRDNRRIAVQAKRYTGSVGISAVQEALSGQVYYRCDAAWLVTTGKFTNNALELANKSGVKLIGRADIGNLMAKFAASNGNG